jgi:ribokinase
MKYSYDVITIGGVTEDLFFTVDDYIMINNREDVLRKKLLAFEYGAKIGVTRTSESFGGGAANAAAAFSRLSLKTAIIAAIGDDTRGKGILDNLKVNKIDTRLIQKIKRGQSGLSFILVSPKHDHIVFTHRGANSELKIGVAEIKALRAAHWTYLTSLSGPWQKVLKSVFASAHCIAWNPGRKQLAAGFMSLRSYLKKTDVLICNRDEAIELAMSHPNLGSDNVKGLDDIRQLLKIIRDFGCRLVIITNGGHGADAYDGQTFYYQKAIAVKKIIDTTGVGDAFGSSFVAGLEKYKGDIKKALLLAAKNAAAVLSKHSAQRGLLLKRNL